MYSGPERRRFKRIRVNFMVLFSQDNLLSKLRIAKTKETYAVMVDMSEGGMAILTDNEVSVGTSLELKFTIPPISRVTYMNRPIPIAAKGIVKYTKSAGRDGYRIGIEFTDIRPGDSSIISDFVKSF